MSSSIPVALGAVPPSFQIFVAGQEISTTSHHLAARAHEIKAHAWNGMDEDHAVDEEHRGCYGVAKIIKRLVNEIIIPNRPLSQDGQRLAEVIGGVDAEDQDQAFRQAAQTHGSIDWNINEATYELTLRVAVEEAQYADLNFSTDERSTLSLQGRTLVLKLDYNDFIGNHTALDLGFCCQQAIIQVRHAIAYCSQDARPLREEGVGMSAEYASSDEEGVTYDDSQRLSPRAGLSPRQGECEDSALITSLWDADSEEENISGSDSADDHTRTTPPPDGGRCRATVGDLPTNGFSADATAARTRTGAPGGGDVAGAARRRRSSSGDTAAAQRRLDGLEAGARTEDAGEIARLRKLLEEALDRAEKLERDIQSIVREAQEEKEESARALESSRALQLRLEEAQAARAARAAR